MTPQVDISSRLVDVNGQPLVASLDAGTPAPSFPIVYADGAGGGFYDAVNVSTNRAARPFFATDSHVTLNRWSRERAMSLARWGYVNIPVVKGAIDLMARLTVGLGFTPQTHMSDKALATDADAYCMEKLADIGFMHGESMDELLLHDSRSSDVDGDLGYLMTSDEIGEPKLQLIEAHRIRNGDLNEGIALWKDGPVKNAQLRDGVWIDSYGRRIGFNVALPESDKTIPIEAQNFIYIAERNRPDELRSMTNLIHALAPLQDLYEVLGFAMQSTKKNSEIAAIIETPSPHTFAFGGPQFSMPVFPAVPATSAQSGNPAVPAQPRQSVTREMVFGSGGKIPVLKPGEKFESYSHSQPGPTIEAWSEFIIRGICVGFGVPFEILWNPEAIGGANTRLITALLRARLAQRRAAIVFPKLKRVRFWILSRAIKRKELPYADYSRCDWNPNFVDITVDSGRESRERRQNVLNGMDSWTGYYRDNGQDYIGGALDMRGADIRAQAQLARDLVRDFPEMSFAEAMDRVALLGSAASREAIGGDLPPSVTTNAQPNKK